MKITRTAEALGIKITCSCEPPSEEVNVEWDVPPELVKKGELTVKKSEQSAFSDLMRRVGEHSGMVMLMAAVVYCLTDEEQTVRSLAGQVGYTREAVTMTLFHLHADGLAATENQGKTWRRSCG